jgi:predicted metal-binding protein
MKKKPITISCAADISKLYNQAQLSLFRTAVSECPDIFESSEDFDYRLKKAVERGMSEKEARAAEKSVYAARGWLLL